MASPTTKDHDPVAGRPAVWRLFQRTEVGLLAAVVLVVLLTGVLDSRHTYFSNPRPSAVDILRQTALLGIFTLGAAIVIIAGGIDLSTGSVIAFSGTICAILLLLLAPDEMNRKIEWYRLEGEALNKLEQKGVPGDLVSRLRPLKGQTFKTREDFEAAVREPLSAQEQEAFKDFVTTVGDAARFVKPLDLAVIALAIAGTLVVGLLIGTLHAWLITVIGLPPFVATLASLVGLRSLGRALMASATNNNTQIQIFDTRFRYLATSVWIPVVLFVVLAGLAWLLMSRTVIGRHLHALGGNEQAARLSGIQTDRLKWLAYVLSAMVAAVAGVLYIGEESVADPQRQGVGYELNAIAAAVVGGCSLKGGVGTIPGAVLGALFLRTVIDGVAKIIKAGADVYEGLIVGGVVVVAVALTQLREAGRRGKQFFPGALGAVTVVILSLLAGVMAMLFTGSAIGTGRWIGGLTGVVTLVVLSLAALLEWRRERKGR
jgi:ribose/xylose/arabinose/galactoside ABC-type transport system permease subunit